MYLLFFLTQTIHRQYTLTRDVSSLQVCQWLWGVLFGFYQFICETCIWANDKTINGGISEQNPYALSPFSFCLEPFSVPSTPLLHCLTIFYPPIRKLGRYTGIMVSIWPCVQALSTKYLLNQSAFCNQTWCGGASSWGEVSCKTIGVLPSRSVTTARWGLI